MENKTVNIDGYLLTKQLYNQMTEIDLLKIDYSHLKKLLLIQVSKRENQALEPNYLKLQEKLREIGQEINLFNLHANHFWTDTNIYNPSSQKIEDAVVNWLS